MQLPRCPYRGNTSALRASKGVHNKTFKKIKTKYNANNGQAQKCSKYKFACLVKDWT